MTQTANYITTDEELGEMYKELFCFEPTNKFAFVPPMRKMRAERITHEVLRVIEKHVDTNVVSMRNIHRDLLDMFFKADVDVVTEIDRLEAGLPRRTAWGLTHEEMRIIELQHQARMLNPTPPMFFPVKDKP